MSTYRIAEAWEQPEVLTAFFTDILTNHYDRAIFCCLNEWDWDAMVKIATDLTSEEFNVKLQEHNVILDVIVSGKINFPEHSNIRIHNSNHWFIISGFSDFSWQYESIQDYIDIVRAKSKIRYPFVSLNHRSHPHRCQMIDHLAKRNLIDKGAITWHHTLYPGQEVDYLWEYFEPRVMQLSNNFTNCWHMPPDEYFDSFCQLISESTLESTIMSEKTLMPIYYMKPFLVQSAPKFYQGMDELGFLRYDELFDYSFDLVEDDSIRTEMIADNINRIADLSLGRLEELRIQLEPKIMHNFGNAIRIATDTVLWPPILQEVFEYYNQGANLPHQLTHRFDSVKSYLQRQNLNKG